MRTTSKSFTKGQRNKLRRQMLQDSLRELGEPSALDELLVLIEPIEDFLQADIKAMNSRNPKVRARAQRRVKEIGEFLMPLMSRMCQSHLRVMWEIEHDVNDAK